MLREVGMKRALLALALVILADGVLAAQPVYTYGAFAAISEGFAETVAGALPATAAVGGWSSAYLGQWPRFGVGITTGAAFLPYAQAAEALSALNVSLPGSLDWLQGWGLPLPALSLDARVGGFGFPFDLGLRFGIVPDTAGSLFGSLDASYLLVGADIRVPILKEEGLVPSLSIGAGYTFVSGRVSIGGATGLGGYEVHLTDVDPGLGMLVLTAPAAALLWRTHLIGLRVQLSKELGVFTPHVGLGAAYGFSQAGVGLESEVFYDTGGGPNPLSNADIAAITAAFDAAGQSMPDLSADGLRLFSAGSGLGAYAFGGVALHLRFVVFDLGGVYDLVNEGWGASLNLRAQF
jgi:hypothetical protein